jgi:hypothetical protein
LNFVSYEYAANSIDLEAGVFAPAYDYRALNVGIATVPPH